MNKIIALLIITSLIIVGCAQIEPEVTGKTTIDQASESIEEADNTLVDIEDLETDAELDELENVLDQI